MPCGDTHVIRIVLTVLLHILLKVNGLFFNTGHCYFFKSECYQCFESLCKNNKNAHLE